MIQVPEGYIQITVAKYNKLKETILTLKENNSALREQVAKLSKTSQNSSKPPSSDIVKKTKKEANEKKRKIGAQPGHSKHERKPFLPGEIHDVHEYNLTECPICHSPVEIALSQEPKILQQVEIADLPISIAEHKAYAYWCEHCQECHYAEFPPEVLKAGLFKARITALVAYMKHVCHCSFSNIRKYIRDVLRIKVSRGYLSKIIQKVSQSLALAYEELLKVLPLSSKVNVDETGHKEKIIVAAIQEAPVYVTEDGKVMPGKSEVKNMVKRFVDNGKAYFEFILKSVQAYFNNQLFPSLIPNTS